MARLIMHYTKPMSVKLTIEERIKIGEELTNTLGRIKDEESRGAEVRTDLKTRMTRLESERDQLSRTFMRGEEIRDVLVRIEADDTRELVYEIREDTGEVLTTRIPSDAERQPELPLAGTITQIPGEGSVLTSADGTVIVAEGGEGPDEPRRPGARIGLDEGLRGVRRNSRPPPDPDVWALQLQPPPILGEVGFAPRGP